MHAAYRIFKTKYASDWFDAEGAYRYGGRWNTPGRRILYASASLSLALLEVLIHLEEDEMTPSYSSATVAFDDNFALNVEDFTRLPTGWGDPVIHSTVRSIGDEWARSLASVILRVPSVIVRREFNYLINVEHKDFHKLKLGKPERFVFDNRLIIRQKNSEFKQQ